MDKAALLHAIIAQLQRDLATQTQAALTSRDEATHEESKPENKYDMHAQEAAYLAEGQARLAAELNEAIALYHGLSPAPWPHGKAAGLGALIAVENKGQTNFFYIGPRNGGMEVSLGHHVVTVITPSSPLGKKFLGATVGQAVPMPGRAAAPHHIVAIT
ncbi:MAG TPA: transcription elongation factor [Opitutaceae bacterium]